MKDKKSCVKYLMKDKKSCVLRTKFRLGGTYRVLYRVWGRTYLGIYYKFNPGLMSVCETHSCMPQTHKADKQSRDSEAASNILGVGFRGLGVRVGILCVLLGHQIWKEQVQVGIRHATLISLA